MIIWQSLNYSKATMAMASDRFNSPYLWSVFSPGFFLRVSQIRKFGITKIYACRALANPEAIAIYRLTRYRYFAHVLSAMHSVIYDTLFKR